MLYMSTNYHNRSTLFLSPQMYVYSCVLFFLLMSTLLISPLFISCGNSFLQSWWVRALSLAFGPHGPVLRIWCSLQCPDFSLWNWDPASSSCRLRPPKIILATPTCFLYAPLTQDASMNFILQEPPEEGKW